MRRSRIVPSLAVALAAPFAFAPGAHGAQPNPAVRAAQRPAFGGASADQISEWESTREQQRRSYENMVGGMPVLDKHRITDVLQVRTENKSLVISTPLDTTRNNGFMRAKIDGLNGYALILVKRDAGDASPSNFQFTLADYATPRQIATLTVNAQGTYYTLSKTTQYPGSGYRNIQLSEQKNGSLSDSGGGIQLIVSESGAAGLQPMQIQLDAPDFFSFVRRYPNETEQYIRPLLRELGHESIFAPDPLVAWQVFSDLWKPDPAARKQVMALLPGLNAEDYHTRDSALKRLQSMGREGASVVMHLDRSTLTPEQNARLDSALAPYAQLPLKEAARLRSDPGFLLDCLYGEEQPLRTAALSRLRELIAPDLAFDVSAPREARGIAVGALRQKLLGSREKAAD